MFELHGTEKMQALEQQRDALIGANQELKREIVMLQAECRLAAEYRLVMLGRIRQHQITSPDERSVT